MVKVFKERRLGIGASMKVLSAAMSLDRAALHRAESGDRIPSLSFWVNWADTLGMHLEKTMIAVRKRVGKEAGKPPERKPLL